MIRLIPITEANVRAVTTLRVKPSQERFVAPNAVSIAEWATTTDAEHWAITAGEDVVGYALVSAQLPKYHLWRFMIADRFQGRGYGRAAMALLIDHVRALPDAGRLFVYYVPAEGGPGPFYRGLGFADTGRIEHGEVEAALEL